MKFSTYLLIAGLRAHRLNWSHLTRREMAVLYHYLRNETECGSRLRASLIREGSTA